MKPKVLEGGLNKALHVACYAIINDNIVTYIIDVFNSASVISQIIVHMRMCTPGFVHMFGVVDLFCCHSINV